MKGIKAGLRVLGLSISVGSKAANKALNFAHSVRWTAKSYAFVCPLA
jgi:hypothetical protein